MFVYGMWHTDMDIQAVMNAVSDICLRAHELIHIRIRIPKRVDK